METDPNTNTVMSAETIWNTLSAIDTSESHKSKGKFTYLPWIHAWRIMMQHYPMAQYTYAPETKESNGTVMSYCAVTIGSITREMWLPVMDNRMNSIANPTTRQIQDARMRCLVKCVAMFGLGLHIYDGEELPDAARDKKEAQIIEAAKPKGVAADALEQTPDEFKIDDNTASAYASGISEAIENQDNQGYQQLMYEIREMKDPGTAQIQIGKMMLAQERQAWDELEKRIAEKKAEEAKAEEAKVDDAVAEIAQAKKVRA